MAPPVQVPKAWTRFKRGPEVQEDLPVYSQHRNRVQHRFAGRESMVRLLELERLALSDAASPFFLISASSRGRTRQPSSTFSNRQGSSNQLNLKPQFRRLDGLCGLEIIIFSSDVKRPYLDDPIITSTNNHFLVLTSLALVCSAGPLYVIDLKNTVSII